MRVVLKEVPEFVTQGEVARPRHHELILQNGEHAVGDVLKEVEAALVVLERNPFPVDLLCFVLLLLLFEEVTREQLL